MSSKKTAQRRLSLLAGSSLIATSLATVAFTGAFLAPATALAADECGVQVGTTPIVCSATTYFPGVTYNANGDLVITFTASTTEAGVNGVNLIGDGAEGITFDSATTNTELESRDTVGPLLDVSTVNGDIVIRAEEMDADGQNPAGVTHAIRAIASGAGDVSITTTGNVDAQGSNPAEAIGIEARSGGGNVSIANSADVLGEAYGILAATTGAGSLTLDIDDNVNADNSNGVAAIDTTAGAGLTQINITDGTISGGAGVAISATSASASTGAVNIQNTGGSVVGRVDFSGVTVGGVTFSHTNSGQWSASGASTFGGGDDTLGIAGSGASSLAAGASIDFAGGNDTWTLSSSLVATDASIDFGAGNDVFAFSGTLSVSGLLTLDGLEAFDNSGVVYLGGSTGVVTDGAANDTLRMSGGTFTGSGDARVVMDVALGGGAQAGCATIVAADCLDLRGASTAGVTTLTINDVGAPTGLYDPVGITLVDVEGGSSAAGHFVLDPSTSGYFEDPVFGIGIERLGLFNYAFMYDAANQRHALVGVPRSEAFEYTMLSGAVQSIWHMTADTVTDRQTDLRSAPDTGALWMRATGEYSKRDVTADFSILGTDASFDNSYKLYAGTIIGGLDLIQGRSGDLDYVVGAQIGYVGSSFDLNASPSSGRFTGATGGVYGSIWNPRAFLDATFNLNGLTLDYDAPGLNSKTNTYTTGFGARLEGGMRYRFGEVLLAEPLVTLAFVRTGFEEISLTGGEVRLGDSQSRRAALGLRVGGDIDAQAANWSYYVVGRAWREFDGESQGVVANPGADLPFMDQFDGNFGEAEAGLSLYNDANTLSGFASAGVKWQDGYSAVNMSLGLRMAW